MSTRRILPSTLLAAALVAPLAGAQTVISGSVSDGSGGPLLSGVVYHASGQITVPVSTTLTIQPGAIIKFNGSGLSVDGTLNAVGTSGSPIVFTSINDDSAGGDTNGNGPSSGAPDQWSGVGLGAAADASHLKFVEVRFNGSGFWPAIRLTNCNAWIESCTLRDGQHGLLDLQDNSFPTVTGSSFVNCGDQPPVFNVPIDAVPGFNGNTATGTGLGRYLRVGASTVAGNVSIGVANVLNNCIVLPGLSVPAGRSLTIGAGVFVKMQNFSGITVDGTLVTNGTQADPVVVTTLPDDSYGGDHNNNGPSSGAPDSWFGIAFNATADASALNNTIVRYSGASFNSAIEVFGADITCTDCLFRDNQHSAIDMNGVDAHPQFIRCAFQDNSENATRNISISAVPGFVDCIAVAGIPGQYLRVTNGTVTAPTTISKQNSIGGSIVLATNLFVPAGQSLTLNHGTVFKAETAYSVSVDGVMNVAADASDPVVFTTLPDDQFGGDTNQNGPSSGSPDTWYGVHYNAGSGASNVKGLRVRYSGAGFTPGLNLQSANVTAREVRADSCAHDGIRIGALSGVARDFVAFACNDSGIRVSGGAFAIENASIVNTSGTGLVNTGGAWTGTMKNSILAGNAGEFSSVSSGQVSWSLCSAYAGSNNNFNASPAFVNQAGGDLRLTAGSPCVDAGDPTSSATGGDSAGAPRLTDGNLDGARRIDVGATEFTNVGLSITGTPQPGGSLTLTTSGTAGMSVILVAGLDGQVEFAPYGTLFVNLALPYLFLPLGTIPSSIPATVPANFPVPFELAFQEIAYTSNKANLSNVVHVRFVSP